MVSLSNHDSGNGSILRQAQDERKPKKPITLHRPCALGMSGASIPKSILAGLPIDAATTPAYKESHPTVRESVMNYDYEVYTGDADEQDCSPHPLDVMAVWALYQTIAP